MTETTAGIDVGGLTYRITTDSNNTITEVVVTDTEDGEVRFDGAGVTGDISTYTAVLDASLISVDGIEVGDFIDGIVRSV
jgi:hypothetical protein